MRPRKVPSIDIRINAWCKVDYRKSPSTFTPHNVYATAEINNWSDKYPATRKHPFESYAKTRHSDPSSARGQAGNV